MLSFLANESFGMGGDGAPGSFHQELFCINTFHYVHLTGKARDGRKVGAHTTIRMTRLQNGQVMIMRGNQSTEVEIARGIQVIRPIMRGNRAIKAKVARGIQVIRPYIRR